eukprot:COSAG02_NODE_6642_length_3441_cov_3.462597_6_plen_38_part_01
MAYPHFVHFLHQIYLNRRPYNNAHESFAYTRQKPRTVE